MALNIYFNAIFKIYYKILGTILSSISRSLGCDYSILYQNFLEFPISNFFFFVQILRCPKRQQSWCCCFMCIMPF